MGTIKKFNDYFDSKDKLHESELAEPITRPTTNPTTRPSTRPSTTPGKKPSPLRRDKPSVTPGPNAITDIELANKFLNMTKNNKEIQNLLRKKYNK